MLKYDIHLKPKSSENRNIINLILPFNKSTYYYTEHLINDESLDMEFMRHNIKVKEEGNFMKFIDKFKQHKPDIYKRLTDADKQFIGLYKYKIYHK